MRSSRDHGDVLRTEIIHDLFPNLQSFYPVKRWILHHQLLNLDLVVWKPRVCELTVKTEDRKHNERFESPELKNPTFDIVDSHRGTSHNFTQHTNDMSFLKVMDNISTWTIYLRAHSELRHYRTPWSYSHKKDTFSFCLSHFGAVDRRQWDLHTFLKEHFAPSLLVWSGPLCLIRAQAVDEAAVRA